MINLPTKFEVFISTHYKDMKRDTKCEKWGGLESLKDTEYSAIRSSAYEFLLAFHTNYALSCTVSEI